MRDPFDQQQLKEAKALDQVSYTDDFLGEKAAADAWELSLHSFLKQGGVPFQTEDDLRAKGNLPFLLVAHCKGTIIHIVTAPLLLCQVVRAPPMWYSLRKAK